MPRWPATKTRLLRSSNDGMPVLSVGRAETARLGGDERDIGLDHLTHDFGKAALWPPTEAPARLGRVAEQPVDLGRPEIAWIDRHQRPTGVDVDAMFVLAAAVPLYPAAGLGKGLFDEFAHA